MEVGWPVTKLVTQASHPATQACVSLALACMTLGSGSSLLHMVVLETLPDNLCPGRPPGLKFGFCFPLASPQAHRPWAFSLPD